MTDQAMPLSKSLNLLLHQMGIFQPQSHVDAVPRGFVQPGRVRGGEVEAVTPGHHAGALISVGCCADHGWPHLGLGRGLLSEMSPVQPGLSDMQGCAEGDEDKPASPPAALPISAWGISVLSTGCVELNKNWPCPRLRLQKQVIEGWVPEGCGNPGEDVPAMPLWAASSAARLNLPSRGRTPRGSGCSCPWMPERGLQTRGSNQPALLRL